MGWKCSTAPRRHSTVESSSRADREIGFPVLSRSPALLSVCFCVLQPGHIRRHTACTTHSRQPRQGIFLVCGFYY